MLTASPEHHRDLNRAFPNSHGTLGYAVRLRIALETVQPFVALRHVRYHSLTDLVDAMNSIVETRSLDGVRIDYLDGVVFSADECYLCVGLQTTIPGPVSDYAGQGIYYRSIQHGSGIKHDRLTIYDYLWRWDADWFWCSRAFGAQTRGCGDCGRGATGAAVSIGSCSSTTDGSKSPTASRSGTVVRRENASCRTWKCRSKAVEVR